MPFNWFRRKKQADEQRADTPAPSAPEPDTKPVAGRPAAEAGDARRRRSRGSRGGRGRTRKPEAGAEKAPKAEKKPDSKKPAERDKAERKPKLSARRKR